jgi:hypothetical protein
MRRDMEVTGLGSMHHACKAGRAIWPVYVLVCLIFAACLCNDTTAQGNTPCCGPITSAGAWLAHVLDSMHVELRWLAHEHVNWETGEPAKDAGYKGPGRATHCSAFAAAAAKRLGVSLLRPPQHSQILLASAQAAWLASEQGQQAGWSGVRTSQHAQTLANQGQLVVIVFQSLDPQKPGHIAIIRPSTKSVEALTQEGPQLIQAGKQNFQSIDARTAFQWHHGAWPDGVRYYVHTVD